MVSGQTRVREVNPVAASPARGPKFASATTAPPGECIIKGNVSRKGERIYHMPGERNYDRVQMDKGAGERWFCSDRAGSRRRGGGMPRGSSDGARPRATTFHADLYECFLLAMTRHAGDFTPDDERTGMLRFAKKTG